MPPASSKERRIAVAYSGILHQSVNGCCRANVYETLTCYDDAPKGPQCGLRGEQRGKSSVVQKSSPNPKEHRETRRAQGVHAKDSRAPNTLYAPERPPGRMFAESVLSRLSATSASDTGDERSPICSHLNTRTSPFRNGAIDLVERSFRVD